MLFECAVGCHPELEGADEVDKECASECKLGDKDCYEGCFSHLFEHYDDHHYDDHHYEEGNYTNADDDMQYEDEWNNDPANMHYEDELMNADGTFATDSTHMDDHWDDSTLDDAWDHDTTNYFADDSFSDATSTGGNWLAQVRSRNQLKNRMYLHKNRLWARKRP